MRIAGDGIGDTRWKVPGLLDWSTMTDNPFVEVTKDTTTLYASDRDVFLFLVDDAHPIEAGRLPNGDPDLYFRGFYCWNSEVGSKTLGIASSLFLRAVCMIPCVVREGGLAEEDSLAENVQRAPLHPLDQFRAFLAMREKGMGEEAIAAAFFVSVAVVKQRLRLRRVSPALLDVYAEDA